MANFFLLPTRAWELGVGALIAIREVENPSVWKVIGSKLANLFSILAVGLLAIPVFFYSRSTNFPGLAAVLPVTGAGLLIVTPDSWTNRNVLFPSRWYTSAWYPTLGICGIGHF